MGVKFESINIARMDGSQVQKELEKLQRSNVALAEKYAKVSNESGKAGQVGEKSYMQLKRSVEGYARSLDGPQKKLQQQLATLEAAKAKGISNVGGHGIVKMIEATKEKLAEGAEAVDRFAIRASLLDEKLASGSIGAKSHAAAIEGLKKSALDGASAEQQFAIEAADLDRQLKSGAMGADEHSRKMTGLASSLTKGMSASDQLRVKQAALDKSLASGSITVDAYDSQLAELRNNAAQSAAPIDQLQTKIAELDHDLKRGTIDQKQYTAETAKARATFAMTATATDKYENEIASLNQQFRAGKVDSATYDSRVAKLKKTLKESNVVIAESVNGHDRQSSGLDKLSSKLNTAVASYLGFQAILQKVGEALQWTRSEIEKAKSSFDETSEPRSRLAQIATSAQDLDAMEQSADARAVRFGVDRNKVRELMFSARSEGFEGAVDDILQSERLLSTQSQATVAGQIPALFRGKINSQEAISASLVAAGESRLNFEQMSKGLPTLAASGAMTDASPEETLAVLSVLSSKFKSGETAADRSASLSSKLGLSEEFGGYGIIAGVEKLMNADADTRDEFLGESKELNEAFLAISGEMELIKSRRDAVAKELATIRSGGQSAVEKRTGFIFDASTDTGRKELAARRKRSAMNAREIANERQFVTGGNDTEAVLNNQLASLKDEGRSGIEQWAAETTAKALENLGFGKDTVEFGARAGTVFGGGALQQTYKTLKDVASGNARFSASDEPEMQVAPSALNRRESRAVRAFRNHGLTSDAEITPGGPSGKSLNSAAGMGSLFSSVMATGDVSQIVNATNKQTEAIEQQTRVMHSVDAKLSPKTNAPTSVSAAATMAHGRLGR